MEFPIFRIGDLGGQIDLSSVKRVSEADVPNLDKKRLIRGDILIAKIGIGKTVGMSSVYNFDEPAILSSQVAGVRAKGIEQKFLASFIASSFFHNAIKPHFFGSTRDNISPSHIRLTSIPFPPLPTQRKIAAVLSAYDDLIENNTRRIKILEEMAATVYRQWFVEFRFPGHENAPMTESDLGLIPQGWEVQTLGDVTSVITKGTTPTSLGKQFTAEGVNFIKVQSIDEHGEILDSKLAKIDDVTHELLKRSQLQEYDILFSIAGAIGRVATVPKRLLPANTNQAVAIIRPSCLFFAAYLYHTLRSSNFLNYSLERVVQTAQANVSLSVLSSAPVTIPMKGVLNEFNEHLTPIRNLIDGLRKKIKTSAKPATYYSPNSFQVSLTYPNLTLRLREYNLAQVVF